MGKTTGLTVLVGVLIIAYCAVDTIFDDGEYDYDEDERFSNYYATKLGAYAFAGMVASYVGKPLIKGTGSSGSGARFGSRSRGS